MEALPPEWGIILVDHGSVRAEANSMLLDVVRGFKETTGAEIVEPAHMELAPPTLGQAFDRCIEQGATKIVVHPYFLGPGRHSTTDIPKLAQAAAERHTGIPYSVTAPLGADPRLHEVVLRRIREALADPQ